MNCTIATHAKDDALTTCREMELVTFHCGGLICGIDIRLVKEINACHGVTRAPHARSYILGVMCLRGEVVTVVNLASLLELPPASQRPTTSVIVNLDGQRVALAVDMVVDVMSIPINEIAPLPPNFQNGRDGIFSGVIQRKSGLIMVLDVARAFHHDRPLSERT